MSSSFLLTVLKTLATIFYNLNPVEPSTANIARGSVATFCEMDVPAGLFDGNINRVGVFLWACIGAQKLNIDLQDKHSIHYVVVYEGTGPNPIIGQLNYFEVKVANFEDVDCGSYPGLTTASTENKGLRVNCNPTYDQYQYVSITTQENSDIKIAEVEIHTFASGTAEEMPFLYRGCFSQFSGFGSTMRGGFADCLTSCKRIEKLFVGIKQNIKCHCHDHHDEASELPERNCNLTCSDGRSVCGGIESFSVYLISVRLPTYVGCFESQFIFSDEEELANDEMSIEHCLHNCETMYYAILKDGDTCLCRDRIDNIMYSRHTRDCTLPCSGNHLQNCGGHERWSIYKTCYKNSTEKSKCSNIFKCQRMKYPIFSSCGGNCVFNFSGEHCLARNPPPIATFSTAGPRRTTLSLCRIRNPCANIPLTECVVYRSELKCHCIVGFTKKLRGHGCEDMDECEFEPCNEQYSLCHNKNGSYDCICKAEYVQLSEDICLVNSSGDNWNENIEQPLWRRIFSGKVILIALIVSMSSCAYFIFRKAPPPTDGDIDSQLKTPSITSSPKLKRTLSK